MKPEESKLAFKLVDQHLSFETIKNVEPFQIYENISNK